MDIPTRLDITVERSGEAWNVDLHTDSQHHAARSTSIHRGIALAMFSAGLMCRSHYDAAMSDCAAARA